MPLWVKIGFGTFFGLIVLFGIIMAWAFWMIRVPKIEFNKQDPNVAEKLEGWFQQLHHHKIVPFNGTVYVRSKNEILIRKAYGVDGQDRPLTPDSSLRLASLSKQFTAIGVLTLVRDDKVDLDEPISTYLPGCNFSASLNSLLNHRSGIPDVIYQKAPETDLLTLEGVEALMCDGSVKAAPAGDYAYSNTGYLLAARAIERVTGESFETYMQRAVFDPLEMKNSRVWNLVSERPFPGRAGSFRFVRATEKEALNPSNFDGVAGDGGVFSNLDDLENWDRFWSDDRLLPNKLKQRALTPTSGDYAFGWIRDGDWAWHNGSWLGARTYMARNLKTGDLVILLDNSSNVQTDVIGTRLRAFLED